MDRFELILLRLKANLKQWELADRLQVSPTVICDLERGRRPITPEMETRIKMAIKEGRRTMLEGEEMALCDVLGVEPSELLAKCSDGDLPSYKVFCADRARLRSKGERIPWITLSDDDWRQMKEGGVQPIYWLQAKIKDVRDQVQALTHDVPKWDAAMERSVELQQGLEAAARFRAERERLRGQGK
jgi:DNA-binding XRE family transcriptional regulator